MYINRRFIERDYIMSIEKKSNPYITEEELNNRLDSMDLEWCDLTFKFLPKLTGWQTIIIDNNSNSKVELDDLNGFAFDFYIRNVTELTTERAKKQIREKLEIGA